MISTKLCQRLQPLSCMTIGPLVSFEHGLKSILSQACLSLSSQKIARARDVHGPRLLLIGNPAFSSII